MVTTTEGIGSVHKGLDPTQLCIAKYNGSQCGFCTPGFVMNTHAFLQQNPSPSQQEIENIYGGNLCRCTGYRPILHGMRTLACDYDADADESQKCLIDPSFYVHCKKEITPINMEDLPGYDRQQEPFISKAPIMNGYRPVTLEEVYRLKKKYVSQAGHQAVKLVCGNTGSGVYQNEHPQYLIDISSIVELGKKEETDSGLYVGAAVTIQELMNFISVVIQTTTCPSDHWA